MLFALFEDFEGVTGCPGIYLKKSKGTKKLMTNVTSLVVADMVAPFQEAVRMDMSQRPTTRAGAQQLPAFSVQTQAARHAWRKVAFWMWKDRRWILRKMWKNVEKCGR